MTTSNYMPDVQVEIAFNAGYTTPAASRTWTDVSDYVELKDLLPITFGRGDEFATPDPNRISLTLDNTDGRFTAGYASGAYYPNVKLGRPLRVTVTPPGGSAHVRFFGYVDQWPTEWDGGQAHPKAKITATSRLARIGAGPGLASLASAAAVASQGMVYPLNESSSPAYDLSGLGPPLYQQTFAVVGWLTGTGPDGANTAVRLYGSSEGSEHIGLRWQAAPSPAYSASVVELWVDVPTSPHFLSVDIEGASYSGNLVVGDSGELSWVSAEVVEASATITPGLHHVAFALDGANGNLYLDGVLVDTFVHAGTFGALSLLTVWGTSSGPAGSYLTLSNDEDGIPFRAGVYASASTASEVIEKWATLAGVLSAETAIDATTETVTEDTETGQQPLAVMRKAEATDGGVLFDAPDGTLTYHDRERRYTAASAFTLAAGSQEVEADFSPKLDRTGLVNGATVTGPNEVSVSRLDASSVAEYGLASVQVDTMGSYDMCLQAAYWRIYLGKDPDVRVATLTVDLLAAPTATRDLILAATVGTRFTVTGLPSQAPASSMDFFIEGWVETYGPETHQVTFNTTRRTSKYDVWTVEDAVLGQYDAYPIAW